MNSSPYADERNEELRGWQREWQSFWLAVGFLSRIPMLVPIRYTQALMNESSVYFPLVGLLLGGLYAGLYTLLCLALNPPVALLLVMSFHLWITGAFHEDGLADSVDALGGGYTVEARLHIMKDSRIGTYGTVALVMALALKFALLIDLEYVWLGLLVAPCVARLTPLVLMYTMRYVTDPDQSKSKPIAQNFSARRLLLAAAFVLLASLFFSPWAPGLLPLALGSAALVSLCWGRYLRRTLGGYTGDALGASVIFSELVMLIGLGL